MSDEIREDSAPYNASTDSHEEQRFDAEREHDLDRRVITLETRVEYLATKADIEGVKAVITNPVSEHEGRITSVERTQGYQWMVALGSITIWLISLGLLAGFIYFQAQETRETIRGNGHSSSLKGPATSG